MAELLNGDSPKVIAFYLPQFHEVPENNYWWGQGFTEWTNVRKAKPLFPGHVQPNIPLNDNYYNLLNKDTQEWQSELAMKYGLFGFCYYHYWFKNGKRILEKPAEQMLINKEIKIPFCFCWANENWTRNWDGGNREVMIEQDYGGKKDWKAHFEYLLPFFRDKRYITYSGKPVLIIYKPDLIPEIWSMVRYFRKRAEEEGFPGLYIGYQFPSYRYDLFFRKDIFDFSIGFEPANNRYIRLGQTENNKLNKVRKIIPERIIEVYRKKKMESETFAASSIVSSGEMQKFSFDEAWETILAAEWKPEFLPGAFCGWDNTPRNTKGLVYTGFTVQKFEHYFQALLKRARDEFKPAVFINAWNEWGEGAFLEPDEFYKFEKLETILCCIQSIEN